MVDGKLNKDKIIERIPADLPDRERIVEVIKKCSEESKFYYLHYLNICPFYFFFKA